MFRLLSVVWGIGFVLVCAIEPVSAERGPRKVHAGPVALSSNQSPNQIPKSDQALIAATPRSERSETPAATSAAAPQLRKGRSLRGGAGLSSKQLRSGVRLVRPLQLASTDNSTARHPTLVERKNLKDLLMPEDSLKTAGTFPTGPESGFSHLEIEVSHSQHWFKLLGTSFFRKNDAIKKNVIYECGVGLGAGGFPTPVGIYYVTHIYDDAPWWIPPPNRSWAAGQSPSRRVYGGTMAPLLKKSPIDRKREIQDLEDKISGQVRLDDYGYRFHGTNAPRSIGRNESHGCVRMRPDDAKKVAMLIKENVGVAERRESANGTYVILKSAVRLNLVK
jgi:hypothetical protein